MSHQVFEASIGLVRRAEADVLAHRPQPLAVHVLVDPARERVLTRPADVAVDVAPGQILRTVDGLDRNARVESHVLHGVLPASRNRATTGATSAPRVSCGAWPRSEEHTSELQSRLHLVCRLLLEKKNTKTQAL